VSKARRLLVVLAGAVLISAVYLSYGRFVGPPPRLLDYFGGLALATIFVVVTMVPPLLLVDRLTRTTPRTYRTWLRLVLAILFVSSVWFAAVLLLRQLGVL
jgi:hypothetical protein